MVEGGNHNMKSKYICPTKEDYESAMSFLWSEDLIKKVEYNKGGVYAVIHTEEMPI